jgi:hypothetical protein
VDAALSGNAGRISSIGSEDKQKMTTREADFYAWSRHAAAALRAGDYSQVDMAAVAEELEHMGASERRALINRLAVLLMHLLKWQFQPGIRSRSWELTLIEQRREIQDLLGDNPSLKPQLAEKLGNAYSKALLKAERETQLPAQTFPTSCPYDIEDILREDFYPN